MTGPNRAGNGRDGTAAQSLRNGADTAPYIIAPGPAYVVGKLKSLRAIETLLVICAARVPRTDQTYPISHRKIAHQLHLKSHRRVAGYIDELIEVGLLDYLERGRGPGALSIYRVRGTAVATGDMGVPGSHQNTSPTGDMGVPGTGDSGGPGRWREESLDLDLGEGGKGGLRARKRATHDTSHQPKRGSNGSAKGTLLPADWRASAAGAERACALGFDPEHEANAFRRHYDQVAGPHAFSRNWDLRFLQWLDRAVERREEAKRRAGNRDGARRTADQERARRTSENIFRAAVARR